MNLPNGRLDKYFVGTFAIKKNIDFSISSCEKFGQISNFVQCTDISENEHFTAFIKLLQCSKFSDNKISGLYTQWSTHLIL